MVSDEDQLPTEKQARSNRVELLQRLAVIHEQIDDLRRFHQGIMAICPALDLTSPALVPRGIGHYGCVVRWEKVIDRSHRSAPRR